MQHLLAVDEELSSVKVLHGVLCKPAELMNQCCVHLGASLCLFFFQNIGQRKVIYSNEFVVLTSKRSRVLVFENQREIRGRLGCSEKTESRTIVRLFCTWTRPQPCGWCSHAFPPDRGLGHLHASEAQSESQ